MDPLNGQTSPLRGGGAESLIPGEVHYIFVLQVAAAQHSAGRVFVEENAV